LPAVSLTCTVPPIPLGSANRTVWIAPVAVTTLPPRVRTTLQPRPWRRHRRRETLATATRTLTPRTALNLISSRRRELLRRETSRNRPTEAPLRFG